jgi:ADP-ribosylglycohydrolase
MKTLLTNSPLFRGKITLWGTIVGDALGVPAMYRSREGLKANPFTKMTGGGYYGQPLGTWSHVTSINLILCKNLSSVIDAGDFLLDSYSYLHDKNWTARGNVFAIDQTTLFAIQRFMQHPELNEWATRSEDFCGNGSLTRNMPIFLWNHKNLFSEVRKASYQSSALTHSYPICQSACTLHGFICKFLIKNHSLIDALDLALDRFDAIHLGQGDIFERILDKSILGAPESTIYSTGHVVNSFEAALWCLHNHPSFHDAVLAAVNLGGASHSIASIVGGLAGLREGFDAIPKEWISSLAKHEALEEIIEKTCLECLNRNPEGDES